MTDNKIKEVLCFEIASICCVYNLISIFNSRSYKLLFLIITFFGLLDLAKESFLAYKNNYKMVGPLYLYIFSAAFFNSFVIAWLISVFRYR